MKYKSQLSTLRAELAAMQSTAPTCRLEIYDLFDTSEHTSYSGGGFMDAVRLPREAVDVNEWLQSLNRGA